MFKLNKFKVGDSVFELTRPSQQLIVIRFFSGLYYCRVPGQAENRRLVFFERELRYCLELYAK
jgi:hypothetical protein